MLDENGNYVVEVKLKIRETKYKNANFCEPGRRVYRF